MAATVSAWSKPGAWALDSEEHEAELLQPQPETAVSDFPSLAVAAATKPKKKKKPQTLSLAEFTSKPDQDINLMMLPTAPRERTAEELERGRSGLGGGFNSYGGDRPRRNYGGDEGSNSRWGSRVSDEPRRGGAFGARDLNRDSASSKADEVDNWAAAKKPGVGNGFERREREKGGFFDSQSRADDSDSWVSNKSAVEGRRFGSNAGGGGGFERERKVGFGSSGGADNTDNWNKKKVESFGGSETGNGGFERERKIGFGTSGAADSDNWNKKKVESIGGSETGNGGFERERKIGFGTSGAADSDNWNKKKVELNSGNERPESGNGGGGGRPRLVLQPRSMSASNNESSPDGGSVNVAKPKGSNPFGEARPREQVLAEKGQDWKKIDEQLESVKIKETVEKNDGFGKKSFGSSNGRGTVPEARTEKSWRKALLEDPRPKSAEKVENEQERVEEK